MQYGFVIPNNDVHTAPELAAEAEAAGWDGVFIPDCIMIDTPDNPPAPWYDPWVVLAAMATRTQRVRLGPMLTALPRRRPWKLAQEVLTLDHLSGGRAILAVGVGAAPDDAGFYRVGEPMDRKTRAELMEEGLAIIAGLWRGERFSFDGAHYHVDAMQLLPRPVQQPRPPIWVVGAWPRPKSMSRAVQYDGLLPNLINPDGPPREVVPADIAAMRAWVAEHRPAESGPFDIIWEGRTPGDDPAQAAALVRPFVDAGITWWMEAMWGPPNGLEDVRARIRQGPPRVEA
jgi:hypothetical protein